MRGPDYWDDRYSEPGHVAYGKEPNDFLRTHALQNFTPGGRVLCLAEGEGRNAVFLATKGFTVHGVDLSPVGMENAKALANSLGVGDKSTFVAGDLSVYDLGTSAWDAVVSIWAHTPVELRKSIHERSVRALKPGGVFLLEAYTPANVGRGTGGPPTPDNTMTLVALREELAPLKEIVGQEIERNIDEGKYHHGKSAVVQYIGKKV